MDNLSRAAGGSAVFKLGEQELRVSPLTLGDFAEIEQTLLQRRGDPIRELKEIVKDMPEGVQARLISEAYQDRKRDLYVPIDEVMNYIMTPEGILFALYCSLRKNHPEYNSIDKVRVLVDSIPAADIEKISALMASVSAVDELGNSNGSPENRA